MKNLLGISVIGVAALAMGWVWADDENQLRERAERERVEAERAEALEAALREREALELPEQAREIERERDNPREHEIKELMRLHEEITEMHDLRESMLKSLGEDHPKVRSLTEKMEIAQEQLKNRGRKFRMRDRAQKEGRERLGVKVEHLHAAAAHLDEAGMPEMAAELRSRAENLERELHQHHPEQDLGRHLDELHEQMQDLKREIEELRDEVAQLREQLK